MGSVHFRLGGRPSAPFLWLLIWGRFWGRLPKSLAFNHGVRVRTVWGGSTRVLNGEREGLTGHVGKNGGKQKKKGKKGMQKKGTKSNRWGKCLWTGCFGCWTNCFSPLPHGNRCLRVKDTPTGLSLFALFSFFFSSLLFLGRFDAKVHRGGKWCG